MSFSSIADARNAIGRLQVVFEAELVTEELIIDESLKNAIESSHAAFTWDAAPPEPESAKKKKSGKKDKAAVTPRVSMEVKEENIFKLRDVDITVPRGSLVAIVGPVGSGKTSLLQGLIGEMRRTAGSVKFGGSIAYCGQSAWIQNATIRENICFGKPFDKERYWRAVHDSCLEADLDVLPNGDLTEVGEKVRRLSSRGRSDD